LQDHSFVVLLVPGAIEQCDCSLGSFLSQQRDLFLALLEFLAVARLEFRPFGGIVSKPLSKVRTWCHILEPEIYPRLLPARASRPKPVHEDSPPVVSVRLFVNSFDEDIHRGAIVGRRGGQYLLSTISRRPQVFRYSKALIAD